jgi:flagellar motor switch protein FliN
MEQQNDKAAVREFAVAFAGALSEALRRATAAAFPLEVMNTQEAPTKRAQPVQFRVKIEGNLSGECFVEFYEPQASELIEKLNASKSDAAEGEPGAGLLAAISSSAEGLKASLAAQYGELTLAVDSVSGIAFGGMYVVPLALAGDPASATVLLYFNGDLLESLSSAPAGDAGTESGKNSIHPANLKLVMDVELNVSLRFGQRQLPLREVLELGSGSVVELDRMVDEPVELLLDGKLVARGEAVIVDGNYGLRVTEIPQAMESHFLR